MKNDCCFWFKVFVVVLLIVVLLVVVDDMVVICQCGCLCIVVYNDFLFYVISGGKGIDVEIGWVIVEKFGLMLEIVGFNVDEDMNDDFCNMVWKGYYLGIQLVDVMLYVLVDEYLVWVNDKVCIFGIYYCEFFVLVCNLECVLVLVGFVVVVLEIFIWEKIGVEMVILVDFFLFGVLIGWLWDNVVYFCIVVEVVQGLVDGCVLVVLVLCVEFEVVFVG